MARSRINHRLEKETKRNLLFIIGGVFLLILLGFTLGPRLLVQSSLLLENESENTNKPKENQSIVAPPTVDQLPKATNVQTITVTGSSYSGETVALFLNGTEAKSTTIADDGSFTFENIELTQGENDIKARALTSDNKKSNFSTVQTVLFSTESPDLEILSIQDNETVQKERNPLRIDGKTSVGSDVTVNNFAARVDDKGNFTYSLALRNGENSITIKAVTDAGNTTEKSLKVFLNE